MAIDVANRTTGGKIWEEKSTSVSHHQMRRNCDGLSGCTIWTTTEWSIWRRCVSSSRLWIALRASNLVSYKLTKRQHWKMFEGVIRYDENGNPQTIASTRQRAEEIFKVSITSCYRQVSFSWSQVKLWIQHIFNFPLKLMKNDVHFPGHWQGQWWGVELGRVHGKLCSVKFHLQDFWIIKSKKQITFYVHLSVCTVFFLYGPPWPSNLMSDMI